jgi:hypothetical protein
MSFYLDTVRLDTVRLDGATGTPRPAPSFEQVKRFVANARAWRWQQPFPGGQGSVSAYLACDQATAQEVTLALLRRKRKTSTLAWPHGQIEGAALQEVVAKWRPATGDPAAAGGLLEVELTFDRSADESGDGETPLVYCETAPALAGPWRRETWRVGGSASEGLGTYLGEAEAYENGALADLDSLGRWVRLKRLDNDATLWWGVVVGARDSSVTGSLKARAGYRFYGPGQALAQLHPTMWYEDRADEGADAAGGGVGTYANVGAPLPFNKGGVGDRGASPFTFGGLDVYLHCRGAPRENWTALEAVKTYLAMLAVSWPGLPITLDDQTQGRLDAQIDAWDVAGKNALEALATIISVSRGLAFRVAASEAGLTIQVMDILADGVAIDLSGPEVTAWWADFDEAATADRFFVQGPRPHYLRTLEARNHPDQAQLVRRWTTAEQTAWETATVAQKGDGKLALVWRNLGLIWSYSGRGYLTNAEQIEYTRRVDAFGQETGDLERTGETLPNGRAWQIDRKIPTGDGIDWSDPYRAKTAKVATKGPLAWWYSQTGSGTGATLNYTSLHFTVQISVDPSGGGLIVGSGPEQAAITRREFESGKSLLVTLALIHPLPWRASGVAGVLGIGRSTPPRTDFPRVSFDFLQGDFWTQKIATPQTIYSFDAQGRRVFLGEGRLDSGGDIADARDLLRRWRLTADNAAAWTVGGLDDAEQYPPGTVVASVKVSADRGTASPVDRPLRSPITRRTYNLDPSAPSITWSAQRVAPSLDTPTVVNAPGGLVPAGRLNPYPGGK